MTSIKNLYKNFLRNIRIRLHSTEVAFCECYDLDKETNTLTMHSSIMFIDTRENPTVETFPVVCHECNTHFLLSKHGVLKNYRIFCDG